MEPTLTEKISDLRTAIEKIEGLPEDQRAQIFTSLNDLEPAIPAGDDSHLPLLGQLEQTMLEVEAKHPDTTQLLKSFCEALGRMGL